jgi:cobalt-zinc-cadmium resistance protein CzcA
VGVVYVPVLLLEGVEGKMFRPMAWTVLFALGTALVLAFTWVPVATSLFIRKAHEGDSRVVALARRLYAPVLRGSMAHPFVAIAGAVTLLAGGVLAGSRLGTEFVPRLEEGDFAIQITRPPSVSLREANEGTTAVEAALRKHPEVVRVVSRTGSPDVATDVMGIEQSDVLCMLAPRSKWRPGLTREGLVAELDAELHRALPGTAFGFTQPIEMRFQELLGGLKSDVGVKLYGDDLVTLTRLANELQHAIGTIPGASDVRAEQTSGLAIATIRPSPLKASRLGVRPDEIRAAVEALRAGRTVGTFVEGDRRFDVVVRFDRPPAPGTDALTRHPIVLADGRVLTLGDVADVSIEEGPAQIGREQARRRVLVEVNVRGRDLGSFVGDLEQALKKVPLPPGYFTVLTGQHEHLQHAALRLAIVVPLTLAGIFVLLYLAFNDATPALLIFLNVPMSASGGVIALALRGLTLSISAAVGFIALFGVATLNGVVLLSAAARFENEGFEPREAARMAADERLRPVLTTAVVASLGFFPMALATGTGAEVQRPLATVVIGGLVTATMLTLALLPTLYALVRRRPRGSA